MPPEEHADNQPPTSAAAPSPHDHLRQYQWKPGQSGNPNGRPKGQSVTSLLRELLGQEHNKKKLAALLAERLLKDALQGKLGHIKEVLDRTEGKVADRVQVESAQGQGLIIQVVRRGERPDGGGGAAPAEAPEQVELPPGTRMVEGDCWNTA